MEKTEKWFNLFNDKELIEDKENGYVVIYDDGKYHLGHWIGTGDFQGSVYDKGCWIYENLNEIRDEMKKYTDLNEEEINKVFDIVGEFIILKHIIYKNVNEYDREV